MFKPLSERLSLKATDNKSLADSDFIYNIKIKNMNFNVDVNNKKDQQLVGTKRIFLIM